VEIFEDRLRIDKRALRRVMRERRRTAHEQDPGAAQALRDVFLSCVTLPSTSLVATTIAVRHEIDSAPLNAALVARGHHLCLPVMVSPEQPLLFRLWSPKEALTQGALKIPEPLASSPTVEPDILLVPLLAFDRHGHRLGQGGGYYDRTLALLRAKKKIVAIGLGFAAQEVTAVPTGPNDARLDAVVTEKGIFWADGLQTSWP
jgi:5-formyltetrahydrofolate cyclo-ligase